MIDLTKTFLVIDFLCYNTEKLHVILLSVWISSRNSE